jgi:hypothetical protein
LAVSKGNPAPFRVDHLTRGRVPAPDHSRARPKTQPKLRLAVWFPGPKEKKEEPQPPTSRFGSAGNVIGEFP